MEDCGLIQYSTQIGKNCSSNVKGSKCAVIDGGGKTDWFDVKSGVRQGCVMSGFLFLLVIDWAMRRMLRKGNAGIRWRFTEKLED